MSQHGLTILVTGGRYYSDWQGAFRYLDSLHESPGIDEIVQGECPCGGADAIAFWWARMRKVPCKSFPAVYDNNGRIKGPERNQKMVDYLKTTSIPCCVSFRGGAGTADCVRRAYAADIKVLIVL